MKTTIGSTSLEIESGDITAMKVDAIVNAANDHLWMGSGVAGAIKRAGGADIEDEAVALGPIEVGDNVVTSAGALKARWVIHAAVMGQDLKTDAERIATATYKALETAEHLGVRSLALPALGTGVGGFPLYSCANIMLGQMQQYLREHPHSGLRRVILSAFGDDGRGAFNNAMAGLSRYGITPAKHDTWEF
ncbi:MAG TPA: macro domain-containing protein [Thermoleophilia bacterium]|nr:macro domain-containing protein [Thermoleophilia bacterium]